MTKLYIHIILIILSLTNNLQAQDFKTIGRQHIDVLTQPAFWGRAYTHDGDQKAARYISQQYQLLGALPFEGGYLQEFTIPQVINFTSDVYLSINDQQLVPGQDYIISGNSPSLTLQNDIFIPLDSITYINDDHSATIKLVDKLVFAPKVEYAPSATIQILRSQNITDFSDVDISYNNELTRNYKTNNVIAYLPGTKHPDSFLVITAHYDHIGGYGSQLYFPGANDNASGVAMLLALMKYYSDHPPKYSLVFISFSGEEIGLLGSKYYVNNPKFDLNRIKFLMNVDLVGNGSDGITLVNAIEFPEQFQIINDINHQKHYLPKVNKRGSAANSDHYPFYQNGVPAFFMYSQGGAHHYHDIYDTSENIHLDKFNEISLLIIDFFNELSKN